VDTIKVGGQLLPVVNNRQCKVCRSPYRYRIEMGLLEGKTYAGIVEGLPEDAEVLKRNVQMHALNKHVPSLDQRPNSQCIVCRSPHREWIEKGVQEGQGWPLLAAEFPGISGRNIQDHYRNGHMPKVRNRPRCFESRQEKRGLLGDGYVYFVQFSDRIKIGYTRNPDERMLAIPHDRVIAIISGTRADEKSLQSKFEHLHVTGEWFVASPELVEFAEKQKSEVAV
jgi:hypothetical protein